MHMHARARAIAIDRSVDRVARDVDRIPSIYVTCIYIPSTWYVRT